MKILVLSNKWKDKVFIRDDAIQFYRLGVKTLVPSNKEDNIVVRNDGIDFYQVNNIWDLVDSPHIHNTQHYKLDGSIAEIMGKMKYLFGEPSSLSDGYKTSREYDMAAEVDGDTYYFTVYDWKEYKISIGFEHSLLGQYKDYGKNRWDYNEELEKKIEKAFVDLVNNTDKMSDFVDRFNYDRCRKYGVKNGKPFESL